MGKKKKFRLFDAILATVCITLVAESVMPTAAIGNSQYFWWIFLIIAFCIPYGMISAELGTTYQSEGGMYDWVKRAFGAKWASRVAWNYWVNFPLWIASLAVAVTDVVAGIMDKELSLTSIFMKDTNILFQVMERMLQGIMVAKAKFQSAPSRPFADQCFTKSRIICASAA